MREKDKTSLRWKSDPNKLKYGQTSLAGIQSQKTHRSTRCGLLLSRPDRQAMCIGGKPLGLALSSECKNYALLLYHHEVYLSEVMLSAITDGIWGSFSVGSAQILNS